MGVLVIDSKLVDENGSWDELHLDAARLPDFGQQCSWLSKISNLYTVIGDDVTCCIEFLDGNSRVPRKE